jgi:hypothetical protein
VLCAKDENGDKKISREEFAKHYDKASGEVHSLPPLQGISCRHPVVDRCLLCSLCSAQVMNKQVLTTLIQQSLGSL